MEQHCPFDPLDPLIKALPREIRQKLSYAQFYVSGMGCAGCTSKIHNSLMALPGVVTVEVDLPRKWAGVVFNPEYADAVSMIEAISRASGDSPQVYQARLLD